MKAAKKKAGKAAAVVRRPANKPIGNKTLEIVYLPLEKLKPDPENARRHDERNIDAIQKSVESCGVFQPIVVQAKTHRIIAGHGRFEAFKEAGVDPAPCVVLQVDDVKAREIALRDNRTAELAEWDPAKLQSVLDELDEQFQLSAGDLGFTDDEIDELLGEAEAANDDDGAGEEQAAAGEFKILVLCKNEKEQVKLLEWLGEQGHECRALTS